MEQFDTYLLVLLRELRFPPRLSTRFLEHHPISSPPATQKEVTYLVVLTPNFAYKNSSWKPLGSFNSCQFSRSVASNSLRPWGLQSPIHHQLPELTQTHVRWVWGCHPTISSSVEFVVLFEQEPLIYLPWLSFSVPGLMFLFVWLHCMSSTGT